MYAHSLMPRERFGGFGHYVTEKKEPTGLHCPNGCEGSLLEALSSYMCVNCGFKVSRIVKAIRKKSDWESAWLMFRQEKVHPEYITSPDTSNISYKMQSRHAVSSL